LRRWTELWRQLRDLRQGAFSQLPPEDLLADFCAALLRCAKWRLAQKYLAGTASVALDPGRAEDLVLACAKEYFFSADSLHSPEVAQVNSHRAQLILFGVAFLSWGMLTPVKMVCALSSEACIHGCVEEPCQSGGSPGRLSLCWAAGTGAGVPGCAAQQRGGSGRAQLHQGSAAPAGFWRSDPSPPVLPGAHNSHPLPPLRQT
jgi:hypothetical protein